MAFPQRQAAIVGTYTTEQARTLERTSTSLALEAIKGALADAGLTPGSLVRGTRCAGRATWRSPRPG
jgi:hypothetical protein